MAFPRSYLHQHPRRFRQRLAIKTDDGQMSHIARILIVMPGSFNSPASAVPLAPCAVRASMVKTLFRSISIAGAAQTVFALWSIKLIALHCGCRVWHLPGLKNFT